MNNDTTRYIGDAVYAHHNGYHIILTTGGSPEEHLIYLEPNVLWQLIKYANEKLPWLKHAMMELVEESRNKDE